MSLILFDNDGTLVKGLGPYIPSLQQAIHETFDADVEFSLDQHHGKTDRRILSDILDEHNIRFDYHSLNSCLGIFGSMYQTDKEQTQLIPGVSEALPLLSEHTLGIVTGNNVVMATKKLKLHNLLNYFSVGAFGNETIDRGELINLAIDRATDRGWKGERKQVYYVGDTILDIEAGLEAHVNPIGVLTGRVKDYQEFNDAGAYCHIENLSELLPIVGKN